MIAVPSARSHSLLRRLRRDRNRSQQNFWSLLGNQTMKVEEISPRLQACQMQQMYVERQGFRLL